MIKKFDKDAGCHENAHGCRLVSGGLVCTRECEWLRRYEFVSDLREAQEELARIFKDREEA